MKNLVVRDSGAVLPMAMLMLLVGTIVVVPLLHTVSTGSLIAGHASFAETEDYAGDAGTEDAIWELLYDDLGSSIPNVDDFTTYALGNQINGETVNVTVTAMGTTIAADDIETHTWSGGSGWAGDWVITGDGEINMNHGPCQGTHQVEIEDVTGGTATRIVDLSDQPSGLRFQAWIQMHRMEPGDDVELRFSPDGTQWFVGHTWTDIEDDQTCRFYDIDLTPDPLSDQFRISFVSENNEDDEEFFFDDLKIVGPPRYKIESDVGGRVTTVEVSIDGANATILSWKQA